MYLEPGVRSKTVNGFTLYEGFVATMDAPDVVLWKDYLKVNRPTAQEAVQDAVESIAKRTQYVEDNRKGQ